MKKRLALSVIALVSLLPVARAWENPGFEWSVGADLTSAYLYRGSNYGGTTIQPEISLGYAGLALTGWANIGAEDNSFQAFTPELDLTLSYSILGLTVGITHQYYFDESPYFDLSGNSSAQLEAFAEFNLGELISKAPLSLGWYTFVAGDDLTPEGKRAYSSYIEVAYEGSLPLGFTLTPTIGMTPWRSCYTGYEGGFALNNISLKLNWELELGDHFCLDVYAVGMFNTYGVTKDNIITTVKERYDNQKLNGAIGIGLWLY